MTQGKRQAKGVRQLLRQGHRLVAPLQGLVRIAQKPQGQGGIDCGRPPQGPAHRGTPESRCCWGS